VARYARVCLYRRPELDASRLAPGRLSDPNGGEDSSDEEQERVVGRGELVPNHAPHRNPSRYEGNRYALKARWDATQEDVWRFASARMHPASAEKSLDSSRLSTFVVRVSEDLLQQCAARGEQMCLVVELSMEVHSVPHAKVPGAAERKEARRHGGHGHDKAVIGLDQLEQARHDKQEIKVDVFGGSPETPADILEGDIKSRRWGWRALRRALTRKGIAPKPTLRLRCQGVERAGSKFLRAVASLPPTIITAHVSLPLIMEYHELQAVMGKDKLQTAALRPVLKVFPQVLQDAELLGILSKQWSTQGQTIKDPLKRAQAFKAAVMAMWPYLVAVDRQPVGSAGAHHSHHKTAPDGSAVAAVASSSSIGAQSPSSRKLRQRTAKDQGASSSLFFYTTPDSTSSLLAAEGSKTAPGGSRLRGLSWGSSSQTSAMEEAAINAAHAREADAGTLLFRPFNINETTL
jgi:hypothetical protein